MRARYHNSLMMVLALCAAPATGWAGGDPQECEFGESPDIVAADIHQTARWGNVDGITAYSFGVQHCNPGTCWLNFFFDTNQHPVVGSNMYRLKTVDGSARFEHIGMSWVQHGFFALSSSFCFTDCQPTNGQHLGVHCSDVLSASIQGQPNYLGPRFEINAFTGEFPIPFTSPPVPPVIGRRLQVHDTDLDPALNSGALYFAESHYVSPDDAASGNGTNNASHRRIAVGPAPTYSLALTGLTRREREGIRAWKENGLGIGIPDPAVEEQDVAAPRDGKFIVAARASDLGDGVWHYEYAVQNLTSHRSAGSFSVPLPPGAAVQNAGFHDVDYHSGEPYDLTNWAISVSADAITWSTDVFEENENANALRWGTLYNFRFDVNVPPEPGMVTLGLFRPGTPDSVSAEIVAPAVGVPAAVIVDAVSRKPNPARDSGACDLFLLPPRQSEPRQGGVTELHIAFNVPPGGANPADVSLEQATCAAPAFVPYNGASELDAAVIGSELAVTFTPGLENGRSYRLSLGSGVTVVANQGVEFRGLLGDVNGDGQTNAVDRSLVVGVWTGSGFTCATDLNSDGATNAIDRSSIVGAWTSAQNCAP